MATSIAGLIPESMGSHTALTFAFPGRRPNAPPRCNLAPSWRSAF
ncbi:hypothetical protein QE393_002058 [Pseudomonas sp. SORGH_AS 211]|nr:hypothetical protein [Pseudomonas sp. SORGH_AS_0211]MDR6178798.1 hypothetical protein [Pseudomonas sp. SORGH_AS_0211]